MKLIFIKLGGSLITDKDTPGFARVGIIKKISGEIRTVLESDSDLKIIVGHGSGSFGHVSAKANNTINGVFYQKDWDGFINVWYDAKKLNQIVSEIFIESGLNIMSFPPSASITCHDRVITSWNIDPIKLALDQNIIPIVYGDVVFDNHIGGTILSTEELFIYLAKELSPDRILIAGEEHGVYNDFPQNKSLISKITNSNFKEYQEKIRGSKYTDVTGGMIQKVKTLLDITHFLPEIQILLFSACEDNSIIKAFNGQQPGTIIQK